MRSHCPIKGQAGNHEGTKSCVDAAPRPCRPVSATVGLGDLGCRVYSRIRPEPRHRIYLGAQQVRLKKDVADLARSPTPLAARRPASDIGRSRRTLNQPGHSRQSSGAWLQQEEERSRSDMATTWISSGGLSGHWDVESRTGHPINARAIAQFHGLHISVL
jgi:hypothetical protein